MIFTKPSNLGSFFRAVRYVEQKRAGDLVASNVGASDLRGRYRELEAVASLQPGISEPGRHFVVSADPGDALTREQWAEIAESTMKALGYEEAPWIAYRHHHGNAEHVHLIAARVRFDGGLVSDSFEVDRGQRHMRILERAYGLRRLEPPEQRRRSETPKRDREVSPPEGLREILDGTTSRPQNFGSFAAALAEQGVEVRPSFDPQGNLRGMAYAFREAHVPGSALGRAYAWPRFSAEREIRVTAEDLAIALRLAAVPAASAISAEAEKAVPAIGAEAKAEGVGAVERLFERLKIEDVTASVMDSWGRAEVRRGWNAEHLEKARSWIDLANSGGANEVLFRPSDRSRFVVIAGRCPRLAQAERAGVGPDAVVKIGDRVEAWYVLPAGIEGDQRRGLEAELARVLGGRGSANGFGHLPGYLARDSSRKLHPASLRLPEPRRPEALEALLEGCRLPEPSPVRVREWVPPMTTGGDYRPILDHGEALETLERLRATAGAWREGRADGGREGFEALREMHDRLAAHLGLRSLPEDLDRVAAALEVPGDRTLRSSLESGARMHWSEARVPADVRERAERRREGLERAYRAVKAPRVAQQRRRPLWRAEGRLRRAERAWREGEGGAAESAERWMGARARRDLARDRVVTGDLASFEGLRERVLTGERSDATLGRLREALRAGRGPAVRGSAKTVGEAVRERRQALAEVLVGLRKGRGIAEVNRERLAAAIDRYRIAERTMWALARRAVRAPAPVARATGVQSVVEFAGRMAVRGLKRRTRQLLLVGPLREAFRLFQLGGSLASGNPLGVASAAVTLAIALGSATARFLELGDPTRSRNEGRGR